MEIKRMVHRLYLQGDNADNHERQLVELLEEAWGVEAVVPGQNFTSVFLKRIET